MSKINSKYLNTNLLLQCNSNKHLQKIYKIYKIKNDHRKWHFVIQKNASVFFSSQNMSIIFAEGIFLFFNCFRIFFSPINIRTTMILQRISIVWYNICVQYILWEKNRILAKNLKFVISLSLNKPNGLNLRQLKLRLI